LELFTSVFPCINAWFVAPGYVGLSFVNSTEDTSFIGGIEALLLAMLLLMVQITACGGSSDLRTTSGGGQGKKKKGSLPPE
jgi:hypothetical protein